MKRIKTYILSALLLLVVQNSISNSRQLIKGFDDQDFVCGIQNEVLQQKIMEWLGTPYKGGSNSLQGTDCSGFVKMIYKEVFNIDLVHSSREMIKYVKILKKKSDLKEGDLVFFKIHRRKISHVGIYLRDGYFVHSSTSNGVEIASLETAYYRKTYYRGGRVMLSE